MTTQKDYSTPLSIIAAGLIISGAIFLVYNNNKTQPSGAAGANPNRSAALKNVAPLTDVDHVRGNKNAKIKIYEYSDFECPFCKRLHVTMRRIMKEYPNDVAWVYRHFPLDTLHPKNARKVAVASECAAELGGNDAFWQFADAFFEATPSNDNTDLSVVLPNIVQKLGIDKTKFDTCMTSGKYDRHIQEDVDNAILTGGQGTPWSILVTDTGTYIPINGAQPYEVISQMINSLR